MHHCSPSPLAQSLSCLQLTNPGLQPLNFRHQFSNRRLPSRHGLILILIRVVILGYWSKEAALTLDLGRALVHLTQTLIRVLTLFSLSYWIIILQYPGLPSNHLLDYLTTPISARK